MAGIDGESSGGGNGSSRLPPRLHIDPPLFNSANPWATTLEDLRKLYECKSTGAVTTRTALLHGFPHDDATHQYAFFETGSHVSRGDKEDASINNLGYSPIPLDNYLDFIREIDRERKDRGEGKGKGKGKMKPFIISVTGSPDEIAECYRRIATCQSVVVVDIPLAMEINLSCPNIPGRPPPAYEGAALRNYLGRMTEAARAHSIPWGVKTPPYTHAGQFDMLVSALRDYSGVSFVTATNTLGSCLVLDHDGLEQVLPGAGMGIGGMAGAPLHPLALGNVATLRRMLDEKPETKHVMLLGIGGVSDARGYRRMKSVGADAVGVGTALGIKGVGIFGEIEKGLMGIWEV
ncbi:hypothetical protein GGS20DRAFT_245862 [Poronia punctata]|nr:hypothetical protein GGS20DRAFT_245862 [Poronia punctata]